MADWQDEGWELVAEGGGGNFRWLERIEVPGGWMYRTCAMGDDGIAAMALAFVPTPDPFAGAKLVSYRPATAEEQAEYAERDESVGGQMTLTQEQMIEMFKGRR